MKALQKTDELKKRFSNIPNHLDIVNIGSGPSCYDFDWSTLPEISGYNMAISPEDFRYDARIIKRYGNHVKFGGVVVVVVCPLSFGKNAYLYKDSFSEKYISILPASDVDLPEWKYSLFTKIPFSLKVKSFIFKSANRLYSRLHQLFVQEHHEVISPAEVMVRGWISDNEYLSDLKDPAQAGHYREVFKEKKKDLKKVIDYCHVQKLNPVIIIPPMSRELRGNISDDFLRSFLYDNLQSIAENSTPILDYIDDERFRDEKYYTNGLFLTPEKRKDFTRTVWDDIKTAI